MCKDKSYTETNEIKSETLHWHTVKAFVLVHWMCAHSACVCAHAPKIDIEELETEKNQSVEKESYKPIMRWRRKKATKTECKHTWIVDGSKKGIMKGKKATQATMGFLLIKCYYWVLTHNVEIARRDFILYLSLSRSRCVCAALPPLRSPSLFSIKNVLCSLFIRFIFLNDFNSLHTQRIYTLIIVWCACVRIQGSKPINFFFTFRFSFSLWVHSSVVFAQFNGLFSFLSIQTQFYAKWNENYSTHNTFETFRG